MKRRFCLRDLAAWCLFLAFLALVVAGGELSSQAYRRFMGGVDLRVGPLVFFYVFGMVSTIYVVRAAIDLVLILGWFFKRR